MNTSLSEETTVLDGAEAPNVSVASVALYIDADNQSPHCAKTLLGVLRDDFGARVVSATVAGNNHGQQVDGWRDALVSECAELSVRALVAPHRKQAADVALLMALGAGLERHVRRGETVVVVSRDDLVIGAAEQVKAHGCRTLIAYADGGIPSARNPHLSTLLLPASDKAPMDAVPAARVSAPADPQSKASGDSVATVLAQVRGMCKPKSGGGYSPAEVGQALSKLGYDKAARARFLASVPGLRKRGTGAQMTLVF
jgi:hypothetical protein